MVGRAATIPEEFGPLDLLVVQPTPFCNIDCSYCYLPGRASKKRISPEVLHALFAEVFSSGVARRPFTVVWHAGEPLVLPPSFYRRAFDILHEHNADDVAVLHSFQTNATLIDREWCDLILEHRLHVGVSIDGPDFLHDRHRKTRDGRGTHARALAGIERLASAGIPFHAITVVTREALDYPDELYDFYVRHGIHEVGFNVEEIEGPHRNSSLESDDGPARFARFLARFFDLATREGSPLRIREFDAALAGLFRGDLQGPVRTHENVPLAIISVDCLGNFSTFSPELLGLPSRHYGDFALGNVLEGTFAGAIATPKFRAIAGDVAAGIARCRLECAYFEHCGGGAPVNKYFENGSFDSTETMFCRLNRQVMLDTILDKLEASRPEDGDASQPSFNRGRAPCDSKPA